MGSRCARDSNEIIRKFCAKDNAAIPKIANRVACGLVSTLRANQPNTRPLGGAGLRPAIVSATL